MDLDYLEPRSLPEATSFLNEWGPCATVIAGGTDLVPRLRSGELAPRYLVGLYKLEELTGLGMTPRGTLRLGACTTFGDLHSAPETRDSFHLLSEMADCMGTPQIRNLATLGGNLCNCSPCADSAPVLLCHNATAHICGPTGDRYLGIDEFFLGPGRTAMERGEILVDLEVPRLPEGAAWMYLKVGRNRGVDLAVVSLAAVGYSDKDRPSGYGFRLSMGSVAPVPIRAHAAEGILAEGVGEEAIDAAVDAAVEAIQPISDVRAGAAYRTAVVRNLTGKAIRQVLRRLA